VRLAHQLERRLWRIGSTVAENFAAGPDRGRWSQSIHIPVLTTQSNQIGAISYHL
jgi:hypothetical protein